MTTVQNLRKGRDPRTAPTSWLQREQPGRADLSDRFLSCRWLAVVQIAVAVVIAVSSGNAAHSQDRGFNPRVVIPRPFPPIKDAPMVSAAQADEMLGESELVIGVTVNDESRAYPINMLTGPQREIINDRLGDRSIAVTWCHLCHNGIVYSSRVGDRDLTFIVSGMLWKHNLVMRDLETGSLWSHMLGRAMRGPLEGAELESLPSVMTEWKTWRDKHPDTTVLNLSRTARQFNRDIYRDPSQFVIGMIEGETVKAWPFDQLSRQPVVNDTVNESPVLIVFLRESHTALVFNRRVNDSVLTFSQTDGKLTDEQTGTQWDPISGQAISGPLEGNTLTPEFGVVAFRRAWQDFYPQSSYWQAP